MTDKQKQVKHWSERVVAFLCLVAVVGVVITDNGMQLWAKPPPKWLYAGLMAVALGVSTEEAKNFLIALMQTWVKAAPRDDK